MCESVSHTCGLTPNSKPYPLSSEYGPYKTVKARLWPWLSDESPQPFEVVPSSFDIGPKNGLMEDLSGYARKVDVRLPGQGNSNSHGERPVHLIITMIKWIRTSRLSITLSLSLSGCEPPLPKVNATGGGLKGSRTVGIVSRQLQLDEPSSFCTGTMTKLSKSTELICTTLKAHETRPSSFVRLIRRRVVKINAIDLRLKRTKLDHNI